MPGHTCVVCGNTHTQDPDASFHRLPSDPARRASWLDAFKLDEGKLKAQSQVCCRHFRDANPKNDPIVSLGKRFASPVKRNNPRAKRAMTRESRKELCDLTTSRSVTPCATQPVFHTSHTILTSKNR